MLSSVSTPSSVNNNAYIDIESATNTRQPATCESYEPLCYPVAVARAMCIVSYILTVLFTTVYIVALLCTHKMSAKDMPIIEFYTIMCIPCILIVLYVILSCIINP